MAETKEEREAVKLRRVAPTFLRAVQRMRRRKEEREAVKLRKVAPTFLRAVQRMRGRHEGPPQALPDPTPDDFGDDGLAASGVPRRPAPSSGSAPAEVSEPDEDGP